MNLNNFKRIHLIGIGGAGMSGIAWILLKMGFTVSGSDISENRLTQRLKENGAIIFKDHKAENINTSDLIVISSAIKEDNPELKMAKEKGLTICHRSDVLAEILQTGKSITIAGTHGKTTTTSMVSLIFERAGLDPIILIGGEINDIGGNAKFGNGGFIIAEADESDGSFLKYHPYQSIVTNVEADHLDYYKDYSEIIETFEQFISQTQNDGCAFLCIDDHGIQSIIRDIKVNFKTFSIKDKNANIRAENITLNPNGSDFTVVIDGKFSGEISLSVPGIHNVSNSLAAIGVSLSNGISLEKISNIITNFKGVRRRFEIKGTSRGVTVIDDYGHHPTEIAATLSSAQIFNQSSKGRTIVVFQPHRYSRTLALSEEFSEVLKNTQILFLTDVYSAGENPIEGVSGETIFNLIRSKGHKNVFYIPDKNTIPEHILSIIQEGDIVLTIGAGDIWKIGEKILIKLNQQSSVNSVS